MTKQDVIAMIRHDMKKQRLWGGDLYLKINDTLYYLDSGIKIVFYEYDITFKLNDVLLGHIMYDDINKLGYSFLDRNHITMAIEQLHKVGRLDPLLF